MWGLYTGRYGVYTQVDMVFIHRWIWCLYTGRCGIFTQVRYGVYTQVRCGVYSQVDVLIIHRSDMVFIHRCAVVGRHDSLLSLSHSCHQILMDWQVCCTQLPANTTHPTNAGSMLGQRRRRWPNIKPALCQCLMLWTANTDAKPTLC